MYQTKESLRPIQLIAFVDWNYQCHYAKRFKSDLPNAIQVLTSATTQIKSELISYISKQRFEISFRLYGGWHRGFEQTTQRRELACIQSEDLFELSPHKNISIIGMDYGESLLGALDKRLINKTKCHILGTCRSRGKLEEEEKMVDTALVSDLIYSASDCSDNSWLAVLADDIDFIPGVFTAEKFIHKSNRKIAFFRKTPEKFVNIEGLRNFN